VALTGIQILKYLPKTNCKECGFSTCMAFAMKVASGQADIDACPYIDPIVKEEIAEALAPPIRKIKLGGDNYTYFLGGESVLFRHDKRFENPPLIGTFISTNMKDEEISRRIELYKKLQWERVGITLKSDILFLQDGGLEERFIEIVKKVRDKLPWVALILASSNVETLKKAIEICNDFKPLLYGANFQNFEDFVNLSLSTKVPLTIIGRSLDEVCSLSENALKKGLKELVLDPGSQVLRELFEDLVIIRKSAIKSRFKPLGFPVITFPYRYTDFYLLEVLIASMIICKYGSIIILSDLKPEALFNLLIERMNIYTDPQRPLVVEEGIYPINGPDENSLVAITCNFALTYFIVSGEIEASRIPTWLLVKDTDGLSVLTAWAAGKFGADTIAPFVKNCGIEEKVRHRNLIIPGYLARIKGELEDELPDWKIIVGPREASGIPSFFKKFYEELKKEKNVFEKKKIKEERKIFEKIEILKEEKIITEEEQKVETKKEDGYKVICIAENINIMSKKIGKAIKERNPQLIQQVAKDGVKLGADYLDLNIGPAKKDGLELASWIVKTVEEVVDIPISLDTTNPEAMIAGLKASKQPSRMLINSITIHKERFNKLAPFVAEIGCDVVALLLGEKGLPRDANERADLAVDLVSKLNEYGIPNKKIWVDPVLTPITLDVQQIREIFKFLSILQEITPEVKTIVGLSNVSNGVATHLRPHLVKKEYLILE